MAKTSQKLLIGTLATAIVAGVLVLGGTLLLEPSAEEKALAEAGQLYAKKGHLEAKELFKNVEEGLYGEVDMSDEGLRYLSGQPTGCVLNEAKGTLGGQWRIVGWIESSSGNLKELSEELLELYPELSVETIEKGSLLLTGANGEQVSVKRLGNGKHDVEILSPCHGS